MNTFGHSVRGRYLIFAQRWWRVAGENIQGQKRCTTDSILRRLDVRLRLCNSFACSHHSTWSLGARQADLRGLQIEGNVNLVSGLHSGRTSRAFFEHCFGRAVSRLQTPLRC